ncbi:hypothetical protein RJ640_012240 [Escallonia rubra]|uniref:Activator of Hsp90 ATPase AHSA1-like N-terminal domain-containing protein n=1 Tax=Escallonia rubra TaxID=112253 RepID=A0AA88UCX3_9ASTE|nr:hypothetical protein RJ640_012240 [Escallonia rubra]
MSQVDQVPKLFRNSCQIPHSQGMNSKVKCQNNCFRHPPSSNGFQKDEATLRPSKDCPFLHLKKHSGNKPNLFIQTTKVEKVEGEAYVNVRKGKIIPSYEISLTLGWAGEAKMPPATCCSCNYR